VETWWFKEPLPDGGERQTYWGRWIKDELPAIGNSLQDDHIFVDVETFGHVTRCLVWDTRRVREHRVVHRLLIGRAPGPAV
jgi:hypothetical protein